MTRRQPCRGSSAGTSNGGSGMDTLSTDNCDAFAWVPSRATTSPLLRSPGLSPTENLLGCICLSLRTLKRPLECDEISMAIVSTKPESAAAALVLGRFSAPDALRGQFTRTVVMRTPEGVNAYYPAGRHPNTAVLELDSCGAIVPGSDLLPKLAHHPALQVRHRPSIDVLSIRRM